MIDDRAVLSAASWHDSSSVNTSVSSAASDRPASENIYRIRRMVGGRSDWDVFDRGQLIYHIGTFFC